MSSEFVRIIGVIHDVVNADIGPNMNGAQVIRLDFTAGQETHTIVVSVDAAIVLRNILDGLFAAAGVDDE